MGNIIISPKYKPFNLYSDSAARQTATTVSQIVEVINHSLKSRPLREMKLILDTDKVAQT